MRSLATLLMAVALGVPDPAPPPAFVPAPGSPVAVGKGPADLALGDLDGDGDLDVVTVNHRSRDVTLLLGDGRGGLKAAPGPRPGGTAPPEFVALADLNGDDRLDMLVAGHEGTHDVISLLGNGKGGFTPAPGSPFTMLRSEYAHNHGPVVADVNSDGRPDLLAGNGGRGGGRPSESVSVALGDGKGGFAPAAGSPFGVLGLPGRPAAGDVNGDGRIDVVTPNEASRTITILLGRGDGSFARPPGSPFLLSGDAPSANSVSIGNVNMDGKADLIVAHNGTRQISVLFGDAEGRFTLAPGFPRDVGLHPTRVVIADLNGDGKADLATGVHDPDGVAVLEGDGSGGFAPAPGSPFRTGQNPVRIAAGDVNGDGRMDLVAANRGSDDVSVLLGR